jgi:flagella basal body P-ring formation protein FlgA
MVVSPPDIARGNLVLVRVVAGAAHLTLEAQAESDGYAGRSILLTNIESKRHFQGTVQADGTVLVQTSLARLQTAGRDRESNHADPHITSQTDL